MLRDKISRPVHHEMKKKEQNPACSYRSNWVLHMLSVLTVRDSPVGGGRPPALNPVQSPGWGEPGDTTTHCVPLSALGQRRTGACRLTAENDNGCESMKRKKGLGNFQVTLQFPVPFNPSVGPFTSCNNQTSRPTRRMSAKPLMLLFSFWLSTLMETDGNT